MAVPPGARTTPRRATYSRVRPSNGDIVWMVGRQGLVLRRSASGWTVATAPTSADLSAVEAASATEATVRLASGAGFHTADGGATWTSR